MRTAEIGPYLMCMKQFLEAFSPMGFWRILQKFEKAWDKDESTSAQIKSSKKDRNKKIQKKIRSDAMIFEFLRQCEKRQIKRTLIHYVVSAYESQQEYMYNMPKTCASTEITMHERNQGLKEANKVLDWLSSLDRFIRNRQAPAESNCGEEEECQEKEPKTTEDMEDSSSRKRYEEKRKQEGQSFRQEWKKTFASLQFDETKVYDWKKFDVFGSLVNYGRCSLTMYKSWFQMELIIISYVMGKG
ncbi:unnamed protein product, partial [Porites lobata]